jgi:hypothetical protein
VQGVRLLSDRCALVLPPTDWLQTGAFERALGDTHFMRCQRYRLYAEPVRRYEFAFLWSYRLHLGTSNQATYTSAMLYVLQTQSGSVMLDQVTTMLGALNRVGADGWMDYRTRNGDGSPNYSYNPAYLDAAERQHGWRATRVTGQSVYSLRRELD